MAALQAAAARVPEDLAALQAAIQQAHAVGVFTYKIKEYIKILDGETLKEEARAILCQALAQRSAEAVGAALDRGREVGLAEEELCDAGKIHKALVLEAWQEQAREQLERAVLEEWEFAALDEVIQHATSLDLDLDCAELAVALRRSARMQMDAALGSKDVALLDAAILRGRSSGLGDSELAAASERLEALRRDVARERFGEALRLRDCGILEDAIRHGRDACFTEQELSAMYQEFGEECARYARQQLKLAFEESDTNGVSQAIQQGSAHLEQEELREARRMLARLQLSVATRRVAGAPFRRNLQHLRGALRESLKHDLDDETRFEAMRTIRWAELNVKEEFCDICYEEQETDTMPCCGRDSGGGRICSACLARTLEAGSLCPFCRELII